MPVVSDEARGPRGVLLPVIAGLVVLAWLSIWWLDRAGIGWLFHAHGSARSSHHPQATAWLEGPAFLAGWLLMTIAMMLPTTYPLVVLFRRMVADRPNHGPLVALLLAGYLGAWLGFGLCALALLRALDLLTAVSSVLGTQTWLLASALFLTAGVFQFSSLKYACLDRCRSPFGFLASRWRGQSPFRESFGVGWHHGVFCVGCCWALMLLMFAVGSAGLVWMLSLALVMTVEKNAPWGRRVGRPLGAVLLVAGLAILLRHLVG